MLSNADPWPEEAPGPGGFVALAGPSRRKFGFKSEK